MEEVVGVSLGLLAIVCQRLMVRCGKFDQAFDEALRWHHICTQELCAPFQEKKPARRTLNCNG